MNKADKEKLRQASEELSKVMTKVTDTVLQYEAMSYRTPAEEQEYQKLIGQLKEGLSVMQQAREFFGEELYRNVVAYYFSIKEKVKAGNEKANVIYNDLASDFEQILLTNIDKN